MGRRGDRRRRLPVPGRPAGARTLLAEAGLDDAAATRTYRALWPLLIGHLLNEHPFGHASGAAGAAERPDRSEFEWALRRLLAGVGRMDAWHR